MAESTESVTATIRQIRLVTRKKYGIKAGTKIIFADEGESIRLQPRTREYFRGRREILKGKGLLKSPMLRIGSKRRAFRSNSHRHE